MAAGLSTVVVCLLCVILVPVVSAGDRECKSYTDIGNEYHSSQKCYIGFCCGTCNNRYCCQDSFWRLREDKQDDCYESSGVNETVTIASGVAGIIVVIVLIICCCVCPCCCLYKMCRQPRPVVATTTHTTVVTSTPQQYPQQYPQQPTASPAQPQSYQGGQYPGYQPIPIQPGYGAQPVPQGYGPQPLPTAPYHGQPYAPGPPPPYQEAGYGPAPMPYSQAAYAPGQPAYPPQPPAQPQAQSPPTAPQPAQPDYHAQPAYNPAYGQPPPKSGY